MRRRRRRPHFGGPDHLSRDPALFQVRVLLADCLLRLGQKDRAEHQFREVLALLNGGRDRELALYADLPLPSRERAQRRCRQVLLGR